MSPDVIDPEYVNQIYTVLLQYRDGQYVNNPGMSIMNIMSMRVKHPDTRERPWIVRIFPTPCDAWKEQVTNELSSKLAPGVPKSQVIYDI